MHTVHCEHGPGGFGSGQSGFLAAQHLGRHPGFHGPPLPRSELGRRARVGHDQRGRMAAGPLDDAPDLGNISVQQTQWRSAHLSLWPQDHFHDVTRAARV